MITLAQVFSFLLGWAIGAIGFLIVRLVMYTHENWDKIKRVFKKEKTCFVQEYNPFRNVDLVIVDVVFKFSADGYVRSQDNKEERRLWVRFETDKRISYTTLFALFDSNMKYELDEEDKVCCNGVVYEYYIKNLGCYFTFDYDTAECDEDGNYHVRLSILDEKGFKIWRENYRAKKKLEKEFYDILNIAE